MTSILSLSDDEIKAALYEIIHDQELLQLERDNSIAMDEKTAEKLGLKDRTYD